MRTSAVSGLIFANSNDKLLKRLTENRSMASVPFGSRYRLIDFALSNLVNAGITNVGIITNANYRSLIDHVGSGIYWDLDRKNGGLHILSPYMANDVRRFRGTIDALSAATDFIKRCESDYIVIFAGDVLANIDISDIIKCHVEKKADITTVYHKGLLPYNRDDAMILTLGADSKVEAIAFDCDHAAEYAYGVGVTVIGRELLSKLVNDAVETDLASFNRDILAKKTDELNIYGYEHTEFIALMNGTDDYYAANLAILKKEVRSQLFNPERPIYTKTRDDMPTRYGIECNVKNSVIADGCVIDGTVKNSVLSRGVKVAKGAVVENCIIMQEVKVGANAQICNVIADKNAVIGDDIVMKAPEGKRVFISKNEAL